MRAVAARRSAACTASRRGCVRPRVAAIAAAHVPAVRRSRGSSTASGDGESTGGSGSARLEALERSVALLVHETAELRAEVAALVAATPKKTRPRSTRASFTVAQYNILAGYLGQNTAPWFLYGGDIAGDKRARIFEKFYSRDAKTGALLCAGWPKYVDGILTAEEQAEVERIDREHFEWTVRRPRVLSTVAAMDADLLSLVELDDESYFKPRLAALGYAGLWHKRPRASSLDGCGVFWKRDMFELIASDAIDYVDSVLPCGTPQKDRSAVITLLRFTGGERQDLIFVSTHLARNPEDPAQDRLRTRQVAQLLYRLEQFAAANKATAAPVILTGDLNATKFTQMRVFLAAISALSRAGGERAATVLHPCVWGLRDVPSRATSVTEVRETWSHLCINTGVLMKRSFYQDRLKINMRKCSIQAFSCRRGISASTRSSTSRMR
jgi:endonuclease/exonuclease/phosphatase family metal-dependent hydrolase